jgi:hypothetical protein
LPHATYWLERITDLNRSLRPVSSDKYKRGELTFAELEELVANHDFEPEESGKRTLRARCWTLTTGTTVADLIPEA